MTPLNKELDSPLSAEPLKRLKEVRAKGGLLRRCGARFAAFRLARSRARSNGHAETACQWVLVGKINLGH